MSDSRQTDAEMLADFIGRTLSRKLGTTQRAHALKLLESITARAEAAEREAATLREALAFYADKENYRMEVRNAPVTGERYGAPGPIARDEGSRARAALAGAGRSTEARRGAPSVSRETHTRAG